MALGRARAHSLIQGIGGASRTSIELVLGRIPEPSYSPTTGTSCLGDASDIDESEGGAEQPGKPDALPYDLNCARFVGHEN